MQKQSLYTQNYWHSTAKRAEKLVDTCETDATRNDLQQGFLAQQTTEPIKLHVTSFALRIVVKNRPVKHRTNLDKLNILASWLGSLLDLILLKSSTSMT
jgi:hypothetical protein